MTYELALDKVTMTYSWHNISDGETSWETVTSVDGMYTYLELNDYLHQYMNCRCKKDDVYYIKLTFVQSTYKILIQIDNNYQLDLRNSK